MTASTSSSPPGPGTPGSSQPRHRASGGRGYGRETETSGPIPTAPREGGRHRAPDAPPSSGFRIVPDPREAAEETARGDGPGAGFRPLPPADPTTPAGPTPPPASGLSSIGVPLGAVPTQREPAPRPRRPEAEPRAAVPRHRPARPEPDAVRDDEAVTVPIRREALDRAAARGPADPGAAGPAGHDRPPRPVEVLEDPPLRPLTAQRRPAATPVRPAPRPTPRPRSAARDDVPHRPTVAGPTVAGSSVAGSSVASAAAGPSAPRRGVAPWETPPVDEASARLGLVAIVVGLVGALVGLAPASGLLPRVLPTSALGVTPVFNLVGALLGVLALGLGAVAMFRAVATSRGLLAGVVGACAGAAAIVVGLVV